jgi:3-methyladenine DNA glycosylase/8-oxoguanine DNA glycosylase
MTAFLEAAAKARRTLMRRDAVLKEIIRRVGPCTLQPVGNEFHILVRSIVSQLISTKAAITISGRVETAVGPLGLTPEGIAAQSEETLRGCGLSRNKALAMHDLARRTLNGALPLAAFGDLTDDEVIAKLVEVRGIGRWTAEMYLIFALGRLDVLPVDDFGFRAGVKESFGMAEMPGRKELQELGENWRPYRSIATWYFWRSRGGVPQSE